jgi:hypothetical protein
MSMLLAPLALSFMQVASAAPAAPLPDLTLEQSGALRCSVAFGRGHKAQEFFVRTTARLMDELGADRRTIMGLVMREHTALAETPEQLDEVMPACLMLLDAAGL